MIGQIVIGEIGLQDGQRGLRDDGGAFLDRGELVQNKVLPVADLGGVEERLPVKARRIRQEFDFGARVIVRLGLAPFLDRPLDAGKCGLEVARISPGLGIVHPSMCARVEHALDMGGVLPAKFGELRILAQVIVAIGNPKSRLPEVQRVSIRVFQVGRDTHVKGRS